MTCPIASIVVLGKKQAIDARVFILEKDLSSLRLSPNSLKSITLFKRMSSPLVIQTVFRMFRSLVVARDSTSGNRMTSSLIYCSNRPLLSFHRKEMVGEEECYWLHPFFLLYSPLFQWSLDLPYSCPVLQLEVLSSRLACLPKQSSRIY